MSKSKHKAGKADKSDAEDASSANFQETPGTDPDTLPFPEWSDQELNLEKWDLESKDRGSISVKTSFEDPQKVNLPPRLAAKEWKRCSEVYPGAALVVFVNKPTYPDLVTFNQHLLRSEFFRSFISSIETLLYIGSSNPFPEEYGSTQYTAQPDRSWRPWHHIYSNCKIVKGQKEHTPLVNASGKYVVRLYWLGSWKKIYVDDYIPISKSGEILLPVLTDPQPPTTVVTEVDKSKKKPKEASKKWTVEIWPAILCKALLKIASLTWNVGQELNDFDVIQCLTGWVPQKIKARGLAQQTWEVLLASVDRYIWDTKEENASKKSSAKSSDKGKKDKVKSAPVLGIETVPEARRYVVACCTNLNNEDENILITQVRTIPLVRPPPRPELEFWKTFRYEDWAVEKGIIPPDIEKLNIKALKVVSSLRSLASGEPVNDQFEMDSNVGGRSDKSSKSSKQTKGKGQPKYYLEPDPSAWVDFPDISDCLRYLTVYYQPNVFKTKTKISDVNFTGKTTNFQQIVYPYTLKESRNEPLYILTDSVDYKLLVMNLAQTGNVKMLQIPENIEEELSTCLSLEEQDICVDILLKKTTRRKTQTTASQDSSESLTITPYENMPINFVLERYDWQRNAFGNAIGTLRSFGSKSLTLNVDAGRQCFRLWISSQTSYALQMFSDTILTVGNVEAFLTTCSSESQRLTNLCYEFANCFGKLIQSLDMPDYPLSLRNFYACYKPMTRLTQRELVIVHKAFLEEFFRTIKDTSVTPEAEKYTRMLLLQFKTFDYVNPYTEDPHLCPSDFEAGMEVEYAKLMERSAVKVQAFFKGVYIRLLMKKMKQNHKEYLGIFDVLKKIYSELFSSDKKLAICPVMFRSFFERNDMQNLREKFEIYQDLKSVLNVIQFTNVAQFLENTWVPICRYVFYINSLQAITVKISLACNLKSYYVRVFNNDDQNEVTRHTNSVWVGSYKTNIGGYTILCYGWSGNVLKVNSKLMVVTKKMARDNIVIIPDAAISTTALQGIYNPNCRNIVCRHFVKVATDCALTIHLSTSYKDSEIILKFLDKNYRTVSESQGIGETLLPIVRLRCQQPQFKSASSILFSQSKDFEKLRKKSSTKREFSENWSSRSLPHQQSQKSSGIIRVASSATPDVQYVIEATVVEGSWPLTGEEWQVVQRARKKNYLNYLEETIQPPTGKLRKSSTVQYSDKVESPYWVLDVVCNAGDSVLFEEDCKGDHERKNTKKEWFENDQDRYRRAMKLRQDYLDDHLMENPLPLSKEDRSNYPEDFLDTKIEAPDLSRFLMKPLEEVDEDTCKVKTEDDYLEDERQAELLSDEFEERRQAAEDELRSILEEQTENIETLQEWFAASKAESTEMLKGAHELINDYLKKITEAAKGKKKDKGEKSPKKNKK